LDGIVLKRSWAGEVRNVSLLVAIGVNESGYREILGICEGAKEDKTGWSAFLKERGLKGVRLITSDACIGLAESAAEFFPEAGWQRCNRALVPQHLQPRALDQGAGDCGHAAAPPSSDMNARRFIRSPRLHGRARSPALRGRAPWRSSD